MDLKKRVRIETGVLTVLFITTLFLPFCNFYSMIENKKGEWIGEKIETFSVIETPLVIVYSFCFLLLIVSLLSLNRYVLSLINPSVIIITLLVSFYLMMMLHWSGSHRKPELRFGYWFNLTIIVYSIFRGYAWRGAFKATEKGKRNFKVVRTILFCLFTMFIYWLFIHG